MSLFVTLNPEQVRWARQIGTRRFEESKGDPRFAYANREDGIAKHQMGALGELAGAIGLGLEWPARVGTFHELPDVDPFWEIRTTSNPKKIKVAPNDKPDQIVLHVTPAGPVTFQLHGFIEAGWAQANIPLTDPGDRGAPAHFVDVSKMTPIDENFHTTHAWFNHPERGWICAYCPRVYEGPVPASAGMGQPANAGGRAEGQPEASEPG